MSSGIAHSAVMKSPLKINSALVLFLGRAALVLAVYFFISSHLRPPADGMPDRGFLLATVALTFVGLLGVVISCCLKNIETELSKKN